MQQPVNNPDFSLLQNQLSGDLYWDDTMRRLYATDASAYREIPMAVAIPKTDEDIRKLIHFAIENNCSLIPRTAGTSLAGQVVGAGIIVDVSKHFTQILELNQKEGWVRVQPGVVRDELNLYLKEYGLMFAPETSTSNRCMLGGMVGNNSCGANSVVYGSTREHLLEVRGFLSDGSPVHFAACSPEEFNQKLQQDSLEGCLYRKVEEILNKPANRASIEEGFPKPNIPRRNTGYALDMLLRQKPFSPNGPHFNFCSLLAGSEGTLCFTTELKVKVVPLPPAHSGLLCIHCDSVAEALEANLIALKYQPYASELMDNYILECTKANLEQRQNRFFVQGDPGAILVVELRSDSEEEVRVQAAKLERELSEKKLGYHFPLITGADTSRVWALRKAGLGLLSNLKGDAKPQPVIEDTAVDVQELPAYIAEFNKTLEKYGLYCVHYAHAGSGELHLRPILNLKTEEGNRLFHTIADEIARLVKKYKGSLSGEHGDGRLRAEFIRFIVGDHNYELLKQVKNAWDPQGVFNPNKIVDAPPMNSSLRYFPGQETPLFNPEFDWTETEGVIRAAELCNGSGDCRKSHLMGGTMCPSFQATRNERDTTRARANMLREFLQRSDKPNRFAEPGIKEVMDLCLSCKACKSECPSNVDMAKLKAEWQQQYYDTHGVPKRSKLIAAFNSGNKLASKVAPIYNMLSGNNPLSRAGKKALGFAPERSLPRLHSTTWRAWFSKQKLVAQPAANMPSVLLFCDEFTNYNDVPVGQAAVRLLNKLGYTLSMPQHDESGRTWLSKGLVRDAKKIIQKNIDLLYDALLVQPGSWLVGIEPSALLSLRDEYLSLCRADQKEKAQFIAERSLLIDEFIAQEREAGRIKPESFTTETRRVRLHGHCHQKALSSVIYTKKMLSLPQNYEVLLIPSGCCGMAGSFGYEAEHYEVSMQIGELVLFPTVRKMQQDELVAAPGTSCRHQIADGTKRKAWHPVEILERALI
jgi:FAD/FMN-containing dehydrogenase/Fe-S oxidoreductase